MEFMEEKLPPIYVDAPFTFNGIEKKGFKVIYSAQKHFLKAGQPGLNNVPTIFSKIAMSLDGVTKCPDETNRRGEPVFHANSCTSGEVGFTTDHRSTKFKEETQSDYMVAFHHSIRRPSQINRHPRSRTAKT